MIEAREVLNRSTAASYESSCRRINGTLYMFVRWPGHVSARTLDNRLIHAFECTHQWIKSFDGDRVCKSCGEVI